MKPTPRVTLGIAAVAAFAERVVIQESGVVAVPNDIPLDVACLIGCGVQTGVGAVLNTAGVVEGGRTGRRRTCILGPECCT